MESGDEKKGRETLSRMAYEAQLLQGQGRALEQQVGALADGAAQLNVAIDSLKSLKGGDGGAALVPLGAGTMVRAKLTGEKKVLIDVGAGVVVEKELGDAIAVLEKRLEEAEGARGGVERDMLAVSRRLQAIDGEARGLMQKLKMMPGEE